MTTLTPELIATLKSLSPNDKERAVDLLTEDDLPPDPRTPDEWSEEIRRRIEDVESGRAVLLERDEAERQVREALRARGYEL